MKAFHSIRATRPLWSRSVSMSTFLAQKRPPSIACIAPTTSHSRDAEPCRPRGLCFDRSLFSTASGPSVVSGKQSSSDISKKEESECSTAVLETDGKSSVCLANTELWMIVVKTSLSDLLQMN